MSALSIKDECRDGFARWTFNGKEYGDEYLSFNKGERLRLLYVAFYDLDSWAQGMVTHNNGKCIGWFPAVFWSEYKERDPRQDSMNTECSVPSSQVVDLITVVDCLMLAGPCMLLEYLLGDTSVLDNYSKYYFSAWPGLSFIVSVCVTSKKWVHTYIIHRRNERRNKASERYPRLIMDVERYGKPFVYWPVPQWRKWKVDVWWYFDEDSDVSEEGWICEQTCWMNTLAELSYTHKNMYTTGGLYNRLHLKIIPWTWDYDGTFWKEEDHQ